MKKINIRGVMVGILIGIVISVMIVYGATILYNANEVLFVPEDDTWNVTDVKGALDDLYTDSKDLRGKYKIEGEGICNGNVAAPNLNNNDLIPVVIGSNGEVRYADTTDTWYDYCNKVWANAVKLISSPSKEYAVGNVILESDIESYFVWIPKYKYKLWNVDTPSKKTHLIDIVFDTVNTTNIEGESCITPMTSGASGECNNGEYMTHPAFISLGVNGFWVGKFETGYKGATSTASAQVNSNDSSKIIIKPNVYSWRRITVENAFKTSYNYIVKDDIHYSHMMKNTEWGAVAYLSHSRYGIGYEVRINNNPNYITGYGALPSSEQHTYPGDTTKYDKYNTSSGYLASTTGNITGIYDMSGGAYEYVAGYRSGVTGFISNYDSKYFDIYSSDSTQTSYNKRILGDATGEMGPIKSFKDDDSNLRYHNAWYSDASNFVDSSSLWFRRGGMYNISVLASQFDFNRDTGNAYEYYGFRVVVE